MKSNIKYVLYILVVVSNIVIAQESYTIDLDPQNSDSLSGNFYVVQVEDVRPKKGKIGAVNINGKMLAANFPRQFASYTYAVLSNINPYTQKGQPVEVKVHQFLIEEKKKGNKNIAQTTVKLEFFTVNSSKSIALVSASAQVEGGKIIGKHSVSILKALEMCLIKFDRLGLPLYSSNKKPIKIPPKAGLYYSFSEVALGQPTKPSKPIKLEVLFTELERYKLKTKKKEDKLQSVYGISDGTNFYLNSRLYSEEPYFIKAKMMGTYFYFEDIIYNYLAQLAFGVVGSAIYEKKVSIIIDTTTGRLKVLDKKGFAEILKTYPDFLNMYEDSSKKIHVQRIIIQKINDDLVIKD